MKKSGAIDLSMFHFGKDGFPLAGEVIRYYRKRMIYTDRTGKRRCWTQADLAKCLNVSKLAVRLMETKSLGLDSIELRRDLVFIFHIPPALLGLASKEDVEKFLQDNCFEDISITSNTNIESASEMQLYNDALYE